MLQTKQHLKDFTKPLSRKYRLCQWTKQNMMLEKEFLDVNIKSTAMCFFFATL